VPSRSCASSLPLVLSWRQTPISKVQKCSTTLKMFSGQLLATSTVPCAFLGSSCAVTPAVPACSSQHCFANLPHIQATDILGSSTGSEHFASRVHGAVYSPFVTAALRALREGYDMGCEVRTSMALCNRERRWQRCSSRVDASSSCVHERKSCTEQFLTRCNLVCRTRVPQNESEQDTSRQQCIQGQWHRSDCRCNNNSTTCNS
jgi:hypothetical protein